MISEPFPKAISQLKLKHAFRGYNPSIISCIESSSESNLMVVDDEESFYSHFTEEVDQKYRCLIINNVEGHEIYLLAIDHKFISDLKGGIADCALFDDSLYNFIEFKTNAEGHSTAQVEKTYRDAMGQIENTYRLFKKKLSDVGVEFDKIVEIVCYIVVSNNFPRINSLEQSLQLEFVQKFNLELSFENVLKFN